MKRFFFMSALLIACTNFCNGQNNVKYHGEANLGYSLGSGSFGYNRVNLHTVQGVKIGDYMSFGIGVGLDWWRGICKEYWEERDMFDLGELTLPIYYNIKGYLPTTNDIAPYLSCDLGYAVAFTEGIKEYGGGFYFSPAAGIKFGSLKAELAFVLQKFDNEDFEWDYETKSAPAFKLSVGYIF